jgi:hypothetical protein
MGSSFLSLRGRSRRPPPVRTPLRARAWPRPAGLPRATRRAASGPADTTRRCRRQVAGRPAARRSISFRSWSPVGCRSRLLLPASLLQERGCPCASRGSLVGATVRLHRQQLSAGMGLVHLLSGRRLGPPRSRRNRDKEHQAYSRSLGRAREGEAVDRRAAGLHDDSSAHRGGRRARWAGGERLDMGLQQSPGCLEGGH